MTLRYEARFRGDRYDALIEKLQRVRIEDSARARNDLRGWSANYAR